jgi:hypothetical protein
MTMTVIFFIHKSLNVTRINGNMGVKLLLFKADLTTGVPFKESNFPSFGVMTDFPNGGGSSSRCDPMSDDSRTDELFCGDVSS